jgi:hypothetical protein
MADTVTLSVALVQDLVNYLGTQPLGTVLPLFNRIVQETRGQLPPSAPPTDLPVPDGPKKPEKPVAPTAPKRVK